MLLSRQYRFIFVHIPKTAGTSMTSALMPYAASKWKLKLNKVLKRFHLPEIAIWNPHPYAKHSTAQELIEALGRDNYDSYFTFAVVRNPWDWHISLYKYILTSPNHDEHEVIKSLGSFDANIRWRCKTTTKFQRDFIYTPENELLVNYVARFENISQDFAAICKYIGIDAELPITNVSNTDPYQEYYTEETRDLVTKAYAPDIEGFGYTFDSYYDVAKIEEIVALSVN